MRTTVTLDADTEALVRRMMSERGISFKRALNDAIRAGARPTQSPPRGFTQVRSMGETSVDLDIALTLAGALEDEELARRMRLGK